MTTAFVVRLDKEQAARLRSAARKRSKSKNAIVREALDKYLAHEKARPARRSVKAKPVRESNKEPDWEASGIPQTEPGKGAGWPERLRELQAMARDVQIKGHPEDDLREIDRNRWR